MITRIAREPALVKQFPFGGQWPAGAQLDEALEVGVLVSDEGQVVFRLEY